jgi:hypothetical protein
MKIGAEAAEKFINTISGALTTLSRYDSYGSAKQVAG